MNGESNRTTAQADNSAECNRVDGVIKMKVLAVFVLILCIAYVPIFIGRLIIFEHATCTLILNALGAVLLLLCPFIAARWKRGIASFDRTWLSLKWSHLIWSVLMLIGVITWGVLSSQVTARLGWWGGMENTMKITLCHVSPAAILFQAAFLIIVLPIVEEIFWRGYALEQFRKVLPGFVALFLQAVLFALVHVEPIGMIIGVLGYGLIFGLWRMRMRSLVPIIIAHMIINALPGIPHYYRLYQRAVSVEATPVGLHYEAFPEELRDAVKEEFENTFKELLAKHQKTKSSREGMRIDFLAHKPMDTAVPEIIKFLGHEDENVRSYALVALVSNYGHRACAHYAKALDSDKPLIVEQVLGIIGQAKCKELMPKVRVVVMKSPSFRVQVSGLLALEDFGDSDGLREIANRHPSEKIRKIARRMLERMLPDEKARSTTVPANLPAK